MTPVEQTFVLQMASVLPADDESGPSLHALPAADDRIAFFTIDPRTTLFETDDAAMAIGFIGGWIGAVQACLAAEIVRLRS